jgi:putative ABC transport system permease protein
VEADDRPGTNNSVVVSDLFWRRRLGAAPGAIGKPIRIDGEPNIVIGVLGRDFRFPSREQVVR